MKVELHLHTTRYSGCAMATGGELMARMVEIGYEAVFITEHDAVWSDGELSQLQKGHPHIRIFPGVELSAGDDLVKHILVLGTNDPTYLSIRDAGEIIRRAKGEGHLTVLAHPFRWEGGAELLETGPLPDAIEHRTANHTPAEAAEAKAAAEELGVALVNAGDVHDVSFLNHFWIETDRPIVSPDDIHTAVLNHAFVNCVGERG